MAPREIVFAPEPAPRAARLSDKATRDQVIDYLQTNLSFTISKDQFSKATRRWGFNKQPRGGRSIQRSPNETASQSTPSEAASNEPSCTTTVDGSTDQGLILTNESSKRPRSGASSSSRSSDITAHGTSSPLPRRPLKRPKPRSESGDNTAESPSYAQLNFATDSDFTFTPSAIESSPRCQYMYDDKLSAEYLSCYRCTKAFSYYCKISIPFQYKAPSAKQRRARMLDMARTAKKRRTCEVVRVMMESELKMNNDRLIGEEPNPCPSNEDEMCPMQSFLFHRHLAQIYAHTSGDTSLVQKNLDKASDFTKVFGPLGPESIGLWALVGLQGKKDHNIPERLLNSLKWDKELFASDMERCLANCWRTLSGPYRLQPFPGYDKEKFNLDVFQLPIHLLLEADTTGTGMPSPLGSKPSYNISAALLDDRE
ncbi:Clr5 domain [Fusarium oxysporum f. sp. vasinfectum]|nr:Clr5 domain [Fusarium oxysporum f. sp. vasinfectum]